MRREYNFGDSVCIDCGVVYQKTGTRQQRCKRCADVANAIRRKKHQDIYLPQHREDAARRASAWYYANKERHNATNRKNYNAGAAREYRERNSERLKKYDKERNIKRKHAMRIWRDNNKEKIAVAAKSWRKRNPERARKISKRSAMKRLMRKRCLPFERIDREAVFNDQGGICPLCGALIKRTERYEIDHIIPLSKGGAHVRCNLQATHVTCNRKKYNRIIGEGNDGLVV